MVIEKLGRYVIVEELGQGAMGVVYKAVDPLIDRTVAIKTINLNLSRDELETFEKRFQREVQSAGKLNHPNIVTIYDVGRTEGVAYMAMEFLEGKELREILDSGVVLPVEKVVHIAAQVCDGLAFAHQHGIVHRDIKPANIMVLKNGMVKITDFGIAQVSSATRTMAGMVMGSPKYMSPEQVVGQTVDGRSDLFSLGVVLYEMLTGKTPFGGENISAIMYQILNEQPVPPRSLNHDIPESLEYIVLRALAKRPDQRYQTAKEMGRDLRHYKTLTRPKDGEPAAGESAPMERRRVPRESLGEATQIIPRPGEAQTRLAADAPVGIWARLSARPGWIGGASLLALLVFVALVTWHSIPPLGSANTAAVAPVVTPPPLAPAPKAPALPPATDHLAQGNTLSASDRAAPVDEPPAKAPPPPKQAAAPREAQRSPSPRKETVPHAPTAVAAAPRTSTAESRVVGADGSAKGTVLLAISPWGEVFVDGVRQGVAPPLRELQLSPGEHTLLVVNEAFPPYTSTVRVEADKAVKLKHKFSSR